MKKTNQQTATDSMRLDKWLWAARFFKTRSLAAEAITGGRVHLDNAPVKASKGIKVGDFLTITRGHSVIEVEVRGLNKQRRPACEAQLLYHETEASVKKRAAEAEKFRMDALARPISDGRPDKRGRRQIQAFKKQVQ